MLQFVHRNCERLVSLNDHSKVLEEFACTGDPRSLDVLVIYAIKVSHCILVLGVQALYEKKKRISRISQDFDEEEFVVSGIHLSLCSEFSWKKCL